MASKRHIRRRSCESKIKHLDLKAAKHHAWKIGKKTGEKYYPYKCKFCNGYHVGRPNYRIVQSIVGHGRIMSKTI